MVSSDTTVSISVGPFERLGAFVVGFDIASDFASEVGFGSKDAASDQIALNFGEPDFDLIKPGRVSRCVMELKVGMDGEELRHGLSFVRREVVGDDVDLLALGLCGDHSSEKGHELRTWCGAGWFCPRPLRGKPGRRRARACHAGNTQSRRARHARAKGAKLDRADREPESRSSHPRRTRPRGPEA